MAEKVAKAGVTRESGYLYYIDEQGDVSRVKKMPDTGTKEHAYWLCFSDKKVGKPEKLAKVGLKQQAGFRYFIDNLGDISRTRM